MKFVYLHPTYVSSVRIIGLNLTCTKLCILWICYRPTSYLYTLSTQNMTRAKWWNTCIASQHLSTFIKEVRDEEKPSRKGYGYDSLQPGQVLSSSHFSHQAPPHMQNARDPSVERWNYCREGCPAIFHKRPLSRHLGLCFLFSAPVFLQTIVFRVCVLDLHPLSPMYALGSWLGPSDEIRLYANNTQRI